MNNIIQLNNECNCGRIKLNQLKYPLLPFNFFIEIYFSSFTRQKSFLIIQLDFFFLSLATYTQLLFYLLRFCQFDKRHAQVVSKEDEFFFQHQTM
jgi:hypothetical protein